MWHNLQLHFENSNTLHMHLLDVLKILPPKYIFNQSINDINQLDSGLCQTFCSSRVSNNVVHALLLLQHCLCAALNLV